MSRSSDQSIQTDGPATPHSAKLFDTDPNMPVIQIVPGSYRHTRIRAHSSNESIEESNQSHGTSSSSHVADDQPLHLSDTFTVTLLDQQGQSSDTSSATLSGRQPLTRSNLTAHRRLSRAHRVAAGIVLTQGEALTQGEGTCISQHSNAKQDSASSDSCQCDREEHPDKAEALFRSLRARGIDIDGVLPQRQSPFAHFGTEKPSDGVQGYRNLDVGSDIWLDVMPELKEKLVEEYWELSELYPNLQNRHGIDSLEYIAFALSNLFLAGRRTLGHRKGSIPIAERMLNFIPECGPSSPEDKPWRFPPLLRDPLAKILERYDMAKIIDYRFDTPPTIQYWLTGAAFNPVCINPVREWGCSSAGRTRRLCPYLSVSIRDEGRGLSRGLMLEEKGLTRGRLGSNMAVALYNRFLLKIERLKTTRKKWTVKHCETLRHYGIELEGNLAYLWVAQIRLDEYEDLPYEPICPSAWSWSGCEIRLLGFAGIETNLADWINEIHRWGLTTYARDVEEDTLICHRTSCCRSQEYGQIIEQDGDGDDDVDDRHSIPRHDEQASLLEEVAAVED